MSQLLSFRYSANTSIEGTPQLVESDEGSCWRPLPLDWRCLEEVVELVAFGEGMSYESGLRRDDLRWHLSLEFPTGTKGFEGSWFHYPPGFQEVVAAINRLCSGHLGELLSRAEILRRAGQVHATDLRERLEAHVRGGANSHFLAGLGPEALSELLHLPDTENTAEAFRILRELYPEVPLEEELVRPRLARMARSLLPWAAGQPGLRGEVVAILLREGRRDSADALADDPELLLEALHRHPCEAEQLTERIARHAPAWLEEAGELCLQRLEDPKGRWEAVRALRFCLPLADRARAAIISRAQPDLSAIQTLEALGVTPECAPFLLRAGAWPLLLRCGADDAWLVPRLFEYLHAPEVAEYLSRCPRELVVPALLALREPGPKAVWLAAHFRPEAESVIERALVAENAGARREALSAQHESHSIPGLREVVAASRDDQARITAAQALGRLDPGEIPWCAEKLAPLLESGLQEVRHKAAWLLAKWGPAAACVRAQLEARFGNTNDPDLKRILKPALPATARDWELTLRMEQGLVRADGEVVEVNGERHSTDAGVWQALWELIYELRAFDLWKGPPWVPLGEGFVLVLERGGKKVDCVTRGDLPFGFPSVLGLVNRLAGGALGWPPVDPAPAIRLAAGEAPNEEVWALMEGDKRVQALLERIPAYREILHHTPVSFARKTLAASLLSQSQRPVIAPEVLKKVLEELTDQPWAADLARDSLTIHPYEAVQALTRLPRDGTLGDALIAALKGTRHRCLYLALRHHCPDRLEEAMAFLRPGLPDPRTLELMVDLGPLTPEDVAVVVKAALANEVDPRYVLPFVPGVPETRALLDQLAQEKSRAQAPLLVRLSEAGAPLARIEEMVTDNDYFLWGVAAVSSDQEGIDRYLARVLPERLGEVVDKFGPRATPALLRLGTPEALWELTRLDDPRAQPVMRQLAWESEDPLLVLAACEALVRAGDLEALERLVSLLENGGTEVEERRSLTREVLLALGRLEGRAAPAGPCLEGLWERHRELAAQTRERMGPSSRPWRRAMCYDSIFVARPYTTFGRTLGQTDGRVVFVREHDWREFWRRVDERGVWVAGESGGHVVCLRLGDREWRSDAVPAWLLQLVEGLAREV